MAQARANFVLYLAYTHIFGGNMVTEQDLWISKSFLVLIGSFMIFSLVGVL